MLNAVKALNLNINENDIKNCFEKYNEEIDFETFKKIIFDYEIENKDIYKKTKGKKIINILWNFICSFVYIKNGFYWIEICVYKKVIDIKVINIICITY